MTTAVCWFLISLLFSMGISINADRLGDGLAQAIDEAITTSISENVYTDEELQKLKAVQKYMDNPIFAEYVLTEEELASIYNHGTYVPSDVVIDAIGEDNWKEFLQGHQLHSYGKNKSITSSDGYTLSFFTDKHPSYNEETGSYNYYVMWYEVTDSSGTVIKRVATFNNTIFALGDQEDASVALSNSYIDEEQKFHILRCDGSQMAVVDCATLFPDGLNTEFPPAVIDGAIIGIIEGADGATYEIGEDGAIVLPDGSVVYPNEDGSYTINNYNYYPTEYNLAAYDDSALLGLLQQVLTRLDSIENALEFETEEEKEKELEETEEIEEAAKEQAGVYDGTLSELLLTAPISQVFPFCLPFDLVRGIKLFSAPPSTPYFNYKLEIPSVGSFQGTTISIVIDFSKFETVAYISRWISTIGFGISLIFISTKIVKGAGA